MGVKIKCAPYGLSLTDQTPHLSMVLRSFPIPQTKHIHWIRLLETGWENEILSKWGTLIHDRHPNLRQPRCPSHCTIIVCEASCTGKCEEQDTKWRKALQEKKQIQLRVQWVIIGAERVVVQVILDNKLHATVYNVPNTTPHITLKVGLGFRARDLSKMIERARTSVWLPLDESGMEGVGVSRDDSLMQIRHLAVTGEPQMVEMCDEGEYTVACPYGNQYCLYGEYKGAGYRCWHVDSHKPLTEHEKPP